MDKEKRVSFQPPEDNSESSISEPKPRPKSQKIIVGNPSTANSRESRKGRVRSQKPPRIVDYFPSPGLGVPQLKHAGGKEAFDAKVRQVIEHGSKNLSSFMNDLFLSEKVIVLGDASVGKTSLIIRFCRDTFSDSHAPTIGVDYVAEKFEINQIMFRLDIWDTAGQDRFRSISKAYYRNAKAVILSFDLGDPESLENTRKWHRDTMEMAPDVALFLVGMKSDLDHKVTNSMAIEVAKDLGCEYFEVSSKMDKGVKHLFDRIVIVLFERSLLEAAVYGDDQPIAPRNTKSNCNIL